MYDGARQTFLAHIYSIYYMILYYVTFNVNRSQTIIHKLSRSLKLLTNAKTIRFNYYEKKKHRLIFNAACYK